MRGFRIVPVLLAISALALPQAAHAGWKLVDPGEARKVARSEIVVTPGEEWNRSTNRPNRWTEVWTQHGTALGELDFFMEIKDGKPLFKEQDKKRAPLPKFSKAMLPTDIVEFFRDTAQIVLGGSAFEIGTVEPATLAGQPGVQFTYTYTSGDNVSRIGEVRAAIISERLYMINFDAPKIHYFDDGIDDARAIMDSARWDG